MSSRFAIRPLGRLGPALGLLLACEQKAAPPADASQPSGLPAAAEAARIPLGDFAAATGLRLEIVSAIGNPYARNAVARGAGERLFTQMNCVGCHGYDAGGGMGPDLTDGFWSYGGFPVEIWNSISEGRPEGMPAYGRMLPPDEIWRLVTYLESIGTPEMRELRARGAGATMKGRPRGRTK